MAEEAQCPYCNALLERKPQRKKKCPSCGNYIRVNDGILYTEDGLKEMHEWWNTYIEMLDEIPTPNPEPSYDENWMKYHLERIMCKNALPS